MLRLYPKQLKERFVSAMSNEPDFEHDENNPFIMRLSGVSYFVYIKNLSPAYFKGSPDITRIQLPFMERFKSIINESIPMIILGYDDKNDVYVNWNPIRIKQRLNTRNNVSLYSRGELQQRVARHEFNSGTLNTGEKFIVFDRSMLPKLFEKLDTLYKDDVIGMSTKINRPAIKEKPSILTEISDPAVIAEILPLLKESKVLEAATICFNHYSSEFKNMNIKDWLNVATSMYSKLV